MSPTQWLACALITLAVQSEAKTDRSHETAEERRDRLERECLREPRWKLQETEHYFVLSSLDDKKSLKEMCERADALRAWMESLFVRPGQSESPTPPKSVLRICASEEEYGRAGGPKSSTCTWRPVEAEALVLADRKVATKASLADAVSNTVASEFIDIELGAPPATWFRVGCAELLVGCELRGREVAVKPRLDRAAFARRLVKEGRFVPLRTLVTLDNSKLYAAEADGTSMTEKCSQVWSFAWFLDEQRRSPRGTSLWAQIPSRYAARWIESRDAEAAQAHAFEGVEFEKLEEAWIDCVEKLR